MRYVPALSLSIYSICTLYSAQLQTNEASSDYNDLFDAITRGTYEDVEDMLNGDNDVDSKDKAGRTPLHLAASQGKEKIVQLLAEKSKDINARDKERKTPLHLAAAQGKDKAVDILLKKGAKPDLEDYDKQTPLHLAAGKQAGKTAGKVTALLLPKMTKKDGKDKNGRTALHIAAEAGHDEVVAKLLEDAATRKSIMDVHDLSGWTALHHAIKTCNKKTAEVLVAKGANINSKHKDETILHLAARAWTKESVQLLLELKPPAEHLLDRGALDKEKRTALLLAAHKNRPEIVELMVHSDVNKEAVNDNGQTLLYQAADKGDKTAASVLLKVGANKEAEAKNRMRPLHAASSKGNMSVVEVLLAHNAALNEPDGEGWTPLGHAAINGHEATAKYLNKKGADRDLRGDDGRTLLHRFAKDQKSKALEILINLGAAVSGADINKRTPLHIAAEYGNTEAVETLLRLAATRNALDTKKRSPLHAAVFSGHLETAQKLHLGHTSVDELNALLFQAVAAKKQQAVTVLEQLGAKLDIWDNDARTPLLVAAQKGDRDMVGLLVKFGKGQDAKDSEGRTLLHRAAEDQDAVAVEELLFVEANTEALDANGCTPLHIASEKLCGDVVNLLLKKKVNVNAKDKKRKTPLHYTTKHGDNGYDMTLKLLREPLIAPDTTNEALQTPLHVLAGSEGEGDAQRTARLFVDRKAGTNKKDNKKQTPLHLAAAAGKTGVVRALLSMPPEQDDDAEDTEFEGNDGAAQTNAEDGNADEEKCAEVNTVDINGQTPLHLAVAANQRAVVELLLSKNPPLDVQDSNGCLPLHLAAASGDEDTVKNLLDPVLEEKKDNAGRIPLGYALLNGHEQATDKLGQTWDVPGEMLSALVAARLSASELATQLSRMAGDGELKAVRLLVELGANVNAGCIAQALSNGHKEVAIMLGQKRGVPEEMISSLAAARLSTAELQTQLSRVTGEGNLNAVQLLLEMGANSNANLLTQAISSGYQQVAVLLGRKFVVPDQMLSTLAAARLSTSELATQLNNMVCNGNLNAVRLLVDLGANVNAKGYSEPWQSYQVNAFVYAVWVRREDIAMFLIERGADRWGTDAYGTTTRAWVQGYLPQLIPRLY